MNEDTLIAENAIKSKARRDKTIDSINKIKTTDPRNPKNRTGKSNWVTDGINVIEGDNDDDCQVRALRNFKRKDFIAIYGGQSTTRNRANERRVVRYSTIDQTYKTIYHFIDGWKQFRAGEKGRWIRATPNGEKANCQVVVHKKEPHLVYVQCIAPIEIGYELFLDYGIPTKKGHTATKTKGKTTTSKPKKATPNATPDVPYDYDQDDSDNARDVPEIEAPAVVSATKKKKNKKHVSNSAKAGITFPVGRVLRQLRTHPNFKRIGISAAVYLASTLEYLCAEMTELAGLKAKYMEKGMPKKRITPRHIFMAVQDDEELKKFTRNAWFPYSGAMPLIHKFLLNNSNKNTESEQRISKSHKPQKRPHKLIPVQQEPAAPSTKGKKQTGANSSDGPVAAHHRQQMTQTGLPVGWDNRVSLTGPWPDNTNALLSRFARRGLRARIIDYHKGFVNISKRLGDWLKCLGFTVKMSTCKTDKVEQIGHSCGVVAARVLTSLVAAGNNWMNVNTKDAVSSEWITIANPLLSFDEDPPRNGRPDRRTKFMFENEVRSVMEKLKEDSSNLLVRHWNWDLDGYKQGSNLTTLYETIREDLMQPNSVTRYLYFNTTVKEEGDAHWLCIAYSMNEEQETSDDETYVYGM